MKKRFNKYNGKTEAADDDQEYMDMEVSNGQVYDEEGRSPSHRLLRLDAVICLRYDWVGAG